MKLLEEHPLNACIIFLNDLIVMITPGYYCSDFRYESDGVFVLGVGFFLQTNFDFLTRHF